MLGDKLPSAPCRVCGRPVTGYWEPNFRPRCVNCFEVEGRLRTYLLEGGKAARRFVATCLQAERAARRTRGTP